MLSKATALAEIEPEVPVESQSPETWWRATVRPALAEMAAYNAATGRYEIARVDSECPREESVGPRGIGPRATT